jgi:small subunit ribosomal protein S17
VYGKTIRGSKKFHAHDETGVARMGDLVSIIECSPKSALKHFELLKVVKAAGELVTDNASDLAAEAPAHKSNKDQPSA